jgi:hypothetical protein
MMVCLLCVAVLFGAEQAIAAQSSGVLLPDIAFHFVCKEAPRGDIERRMEAFLRRSGFKVLNVADVQRQHDAYISDTNIVALDGDRRITEIRSVPGADRRYSLNLYSQPPTNHFSSLEEDILHFVSEDLKCETRQIARKENGEEQRGFYESQVRRVQGLFEEADRINGGRRI